MDNLFKIDWNAVFVPTVSLLEIVLRGTLVYLLLFVVLITEEELLAQLRQEGVENMTGVKKCYLEGDGRISIIAMKKKKMDQTLQSVYYAG